MSSGLMPAIAAQKKPIAVVELFTSQGCSSCPPADAVLRDLAMRDDVIALAYHIDYWDYLGWKDAMASAENTSRQQAYAEAFGETVYTPQMVIDGDRHVIGSERDKVEAALPPSDPEAMSIGVDITAGENSLYINIAEGMERPDGAHVLLVYFQPQRRIGIETGQNAGQEIDYRNVVTSYQTVGIWHGDAMNIEIPKSEIEKKGGGCAVLLQQVDNQGRPGIIMGAAQSLALGD